MKSFGLVRRIDDLGRIVIPKEIRKNLKIRDGDTLEIFIEQDGIVLKKYSIVCDLLNLINSLIDTINKLIKCNILVTSKEKIIACSKNIENKYLGKNISNILLLKIKDRKEYYSDDLVQFIPGGEAMNNFFISPIVANSDTFGSVIIFSDKELNNNEILAGKLLCSFLIKNVEE